MWICPKCQRKFKNRNQDHSCGIYSIEQVFEKIPLEIYTVFKTIHDIVKSYGDMQIRAVKNGVMFSVKSTFLALKPHSKYLAVEFACGSTHDEFPVEKCIQISKTEFAHILRVEKIDEVDDQLIDWLNEAYKFNCAKK